MDLGLGHVDWNEVDENAVGEFAPLPNGWYMLAYTEAEMKPTAAGVNALKARAVVQSGEFAKRLVFDDFNIHNQNPQARQIALSEIKKVCSAMGMPSPAADSSQMLHKPFMAKVVVTPPRKDPKTGKQYDEGNEIKDYKSMAAYQEMLRREQNAAGGGAGGGGGQQQYQQQNNGGQQQQYQQQQHQQNMQEMQQQHQQQQQYQQQGNTSAGDPNAGQSHTGQGGGYTDPSQQQYQQNNGGQQYQQQQNNGGAGGGAGGAGGGMPWE